MLIFALLYATDKHTYKANKKTGPAKGRELIDLYFKIIGPSKSEGSFFSVSIQASGPYIIKKDPGSRLLSRLLEKRNHHESRNRWRYWPCRH